MIDQLERGTPLAVGDYWLNWNMSEPLTVTGETFTRSNGTILARLYERLTKASRRRDGGGGFFTTGEEAWYRQGVYDAFKALQEELSK